MMWKLKFFSWKCLLKSWEMALDFLSDCLQVSMSLKSRQRILGKILRSFNLHYTWNLNFTNFYDESNAVFFVYQTGWIWKLGNCRFTKNSSNEWDIELYRTLISHYWAEHQQKISRQVNFSKNSTKQRLKSSLILTERFCHRCIKFLTAIF